VTSLLFVLFPVRQATVSPADAPHAPMSPFVQDKPPVGPVPEATVSPAKAPNTPTSRFVQDRALVGVLPGQLPSARASVRALGGRVVSLGSQDSFLVVDTKGAVPGWVDLTRGRPGVRYAEPDYLAT